MAMQCDFCHKGVLHGHNVSHSKRRTVRVFRPNLHVAHVMVNGIRTKKKLCTKCLRMYKKVASVVDQAATTQGESVQAAA